MNHPVKQTKLDQMVEDIKALGLDKNPVYYDNTGFTDECSLYTLSPAKPLGECAEAIGTIKDFWLPELFSSAPELALEVKRLREEIIRLTQGGESMGDASKVDKLTRIRAILSDYDIHDLIRSLPDDEMNFEERALVKIWEVVKE